MSLFSIFDLFNANPLNQLIFLSPLIIVSLLLIIASLWQLRRLKARRQSVGVLIMSTLVAYFALVIMLLGLKATGTSYGRAEPVIIVFGVIYLGWLAVGLVGLTLFWGGRRLRGFLTIAYPVSHLAGLLVLFYGFYIEPQWVEVTSTQVLQNKLAPDTPPLKIVVISDVHMERWTRREEEVLHSLDLLQPDLLLIAGDHINTDHPEPETYADLQRFFSGLKAKYGVFAVAGTVDRLEETRKFLAGSAVRLLNDEVATVQINHQSIQLIGVTTSYQQDAQTMTRLNSNLPATDYKILLYHTPDLASEAAQAGVNLYVAGHTHGGQIALPFYGAVFTLSKYGRKYAAGLYQLGGPESTRLYVTRGLGMEGNYMPRLRLFARPEISVITLGSGT